jgi:hypothetical protein
MWEVEEYSKNQKKHADIYKQVVTENSPDKMAGNYNYNYAVWMWDVEEYSKNQKKHADIYK